MALAAPLRDRWWLGAAPVFAGLALLLRVRDAVPRARPPQAGPRAWRPTRDEIARQPSTSRTCEFRVQKIGDLTEAPNAFAAGLGPSRKVVALGHDARSRRSTRDEVRVVIAHEYGHHESQHIWKGLAWYTLLSLPILFVVARVARSVGRSLQPARGARSALLRARGRRTSWCSRSTTCLTRRMEIGGRLGRARDDARPRGRARAVRGVRRHRAPGAGPARVGAPLVRHAPVDRRADRRSDRLAAATNGR